MSAIDDLFGLDGRTIVVAGASRGIGDAIARGIADVGAEVTGIGRSSAPAQPWRGRMHYVSCDMLDRAAFRRVCETAASRTGRIDGYVHVAGITIGTVGTGDRYETFRTTVDRNLVAAHDCCVTAAELMQDDSGASIVCVASIGAIQGFPDNPGYVASKGGLRMLVRALAVDFGARRIRVNCLIPGYVRTSMTEGSYQDPMRHEERRARTILGRWGEPQDLVGATVFLTSRASSYMTGQDLVIDGGWTARGL